MTTTRHITTNRRRTTNTTLPALLLCWLLACCPRLSLGFSASKTTRNNSNRNSNNHNEIYGIPDSGWSSPHWKWGEATGTGQECAVLCRRQYRTPESRRDLIANLVMTKEAIRGGTTTTANNADDEVVSEAAAAAAAAAAQRSPANFEEVKLILALAWQKGLQNGHGGGGGGELRPYGEILDAMVQAERYENKAVAGSGPGRDDDDDDDKDNSLLLVQDMQKRYFFLTPEVDDKIRMNLLLYDGDEDWDWIRRRCSGLVLRALDFEENGL